MTLQNSSIEMSHKDRLSDTRSLRNLFGCFASGVTIISSGIKSQIHGMTANSFVSVSLDPPLALISVAHSTTMHSVLKKNKQFGLSILRNDQAHIATHFAGRPMEGYQPEFSHKGGGVPVLQEALAWMTCAVTESFDVGDHTLFIGQLMDCNYQEEIDPLLYFNGKYAALSR